MFKNIKRRTIIIVIGVILIVGAFLFFKKEDEYTLKINVEPAQASIYVDGQLLINTNSISTTRGSHSIRVFEAGYLEQTQNINLTSDLELNISLISDSFTKFGNEVDLGNITVPTLVGGDYISKDISTGNLILLNKNLAKIGEVSLPDNSNIQNFSTGTNKILILSENGGYFLYTISSQKIEGLNFDEFSPILSLSITKDDKIMISGKYQISGNLSDVYSYNTDSKTGTLIIKNVFANFVLPLTNEKLLFIQTQDQVNSDTASLVDLGTKTKKSIIQKPDFIKQAKAHASEPLIAYIGEGGLTVLNYQSLKKTSVLKDLPEKVVYSWLDKENLIVSNILKNTVFIVNTNSSSISQEVELPRFINKNLVSINRNGSVIQYYYQDTNTSQISIYSAPYQD